jgi:hypothetical protein
MISSVTPETILNFDDVTFYNNDYGDSTVSVSRHFSAVIEQLVVHDDALIVQNM